MFLSSNANAVHLLEKYREKIDWTCICENPKAIHLIEQNMDKADMEILSENPAAIHILEKNLDKVDWHLLSRNVNAVHILEKNLDKVNWRLFLKNPAIFVLDKETMRQQIRDFGKIKKNNEDFGFAEELVATALHPRRLERELELYNYNIATDEYMEWDLYQ